MLLNLWVSSILSIEFWATSLLEMELSELATIWTCLVVGSILLLEKESMQ